MSTVPYPDIEVAVMDWLLESFPQLEALEDGQPRVDDRTPANLQDLLLDSGIFARISLVTGEDDTVTDYSVVDIDVFADSRATAYASSEEIRARFSGRSHRVGNVVLDRVRTEEKPRRLPWQDENTWRYGATYRISARR